MRIVIYIKQRIVFSILAELFDVLIKKFYAFHWSQHMNTIHSRRMNFSKTSKEETTLSRMKIFHYQIA